MIGRIQRLRKGDQRGVVLISAIILMVVGSILAASVLAMSVSEAKQVEYGLEQTQAQAYARSAVNVVVASVKNDLYELHDKYTVVFALYEEHSNSNIELERLYNEEPDNEGDIDRVRDEVYKLGEKVLIESDMYNIALDKFENKYFSTYSQDFSLSGLLVNSPNTEVVAHVYGNYTGSDSFKEQMKTNISVDRKEVGNGLVVGNTKLELILAKPTPLVVTNAVFTPGEEGSSSIKSVNNGVYHTFDRAVIAHNKFNMYNSVSISGTIDYYGDKNTYDPPTIRHVETGRDVHGNIVNAAYKPIYTNANQLLSTLQYHLGSSNYSEQGNRTFSGGSITSGNSGKYGSISMSGAIEVNTQNNDVVLYANSLAFAEGTSITVTGPNELIILLDDNGKSEPVVNATKGVQIKNKEGSSRPLTKIFVAKTNNGSPQIRFGGGDSEVEAYIYAPDHDIIINHDVNTIGKYKGALVGRDVSVSRASVSYVASGQRFLCTEYEEGIVPEGGPGSSLNPDTPNDGNEIEDGLKMLNLKYYPYDETTLIWIR